MTVYDELRIEVSPSHTEGQWTTRILKWTAASFQGQEFTLPRIVSAQHLGQLRALDKSNELLLRTIGQAIWNSLIGPETRIALGVAVDHANDAGRAVRLVFVLRDSDSNANEVRLSEVPIEALCQPGNANGGTFLVVEGKRIPVSRALTERAQPPQPIGFPLRMLLVVSMPNDKPAANAKDEATQIRTQLKPLIDGGTLTVETLEQPTRTSLIEALTRLDPHILHFVGHGGFDVVGDDETPRAHVYLVRANGNSDPVDASTLSVMLGAQQTRLVVLSACQTAAPVADAPPGPYPVRALDGIAQRLVIDNSGVSAVVAMQYDFETWAAPPFAGTLYKELLVDDKPLDVAVTLARRAVIQNGEIGRRAWVTPAIYWQCEGGILFDRSALPADRRALFEKLEAEMGVYRKTLASVSTLGTLASAPEMQTVFSEWVAEFESRNRQCAEILTRSMRVESVIASAAPQSCSLYLRWNGPRPKSVSLRIQHPSVTSRILGTNGTQVMSENVPNDYRASITIPPGLVLTAETEIATVELTAPNPGLFAISIADVRVTTDQEISCRGLSSVALRPF